MRFHFGPPPDNLEFTPDPRWQPFVEPGPKTFLWASLPLGVLAAGAIIILWLCCTDLTWNDELYWFFIENNTWSILLLMTAMLIVHELLHGVFLPGGGLSSNTVFGIWPVKGALYVQYRDELPRNLAISHVIGPFVLLSVVPLLLGLLPYRLVPWLGDNVRAMFFFISVVNALTSCADLLYCRLIFFQVPANGIIRHKGFYTYWRT